MRDSIAFSFRMPMELYSKMKYISAENERSLNGELLIAVKSIVNKYEEVNGVIVLDEDKQE